MRDSIKGLKDEEHSIARVTKLGAFLRKYSLDEILQLVNVLKGNMSIIGPRPLLMQYMPLYDENQAKRHLVRPGITGWAQVNGRNAINWNEKFNYDIWYVDNMSFKLDLKIFILTIYKVMKKEGVNKKEGAIMHEWNGNN